MVNTTRKFSTVRGILWIVVFFALLWVFPLLTSNNDHEFELNPNSQEKFPQEFPLATRLTVFRDASSKKRLPRSKVTLQDLVKEASGPVLINFWATWCPPCLEELPSIEMLHRQILSKALQKNSKVPTLVTISVDDRIEDITKLESTLDFKPSFTVVYDREGELARTMGTTKFPETYLVNAQGKILYKWLGPQEWLSDDVLQQLKTHLE
ncbi:MAG: TlpA family protein disulfide reductase [Proteobacteria bacterium]|nr:TlpA family protein disulfide reductase [Pseudomonadota bacterium]NBY20362.1 TlpA family protein disulfide reductase [bacterium]